MGTFQIVFSTPKRKRCACLDFQKHYLYDFKLFSSWGPKKTKQKNK